MKKLQLLIVGIEAVVNLGDAYRPPASVKFLNSARGSWARADRRALLSCLATCWLGYWDEVVIEREIGPQG